MGEKVDISFLFRWKLGANAKMFSFQAKAGLQWQVKRMLTALFYAWNLLADNLVFSERKKKPSWNRYSGYSFQRLNIANEGNCWLRDTRILRSTLSLRGSGWCVCDLYLLHFLSRERMRSSSGTLRLRMEEKDAVKKGLLKGAGPTRKDTC